MAENVCDFDMMAIQELHDMDYKAIMDHIKKMREEEGKQKTENCNNLTEP